MALLEIVESGHHHVSDLRDELDRVREALDRTDAVLGGADTALARAESGIVATRSAAPYVLIGIGVAAAAIVGIAIWRRRQSRAAGE